MAKRNRKNKAKIIDTERERYHGPLITNGVSLGYIKIYPWINLPFCSFFFYWALIGETGSRQGWIKILFLTCIILNVVSILFAFSKFLINRFKFLTYNSDCFAYLERISLDQFYRNDDVCNSRRFKKYRGNISIPSHSILCNIDDVPFYLCLWPLCLVLSPKESRKSLGF